MCLRSGEKAPGRLQELREAPSLISLPEGVPSDSGGVSVRYGTGGKGRLIEMDDFSQPGERFTLPLLSKRLEKPRLCGRVDGEGETLS